MGGSNGSLSRRKPAWAYREPSQGRRLHNKRVHLGLQFLVGSSGQPLLPSAIPSTLSTTGCQSPANGQRPPAIGQRPLSIYSFCFFPMRLSSLYSSIFVSIASHRILHQFHAQWNSRCHLIIITHRPPAIVRTTVILHSESATLSSSAYNTVE